VSASGRAGFRVAPAISGGGAVSASARAGRDGIPSLTGGGVAAAAASGDHRPQATIVGGGAFLVLARGAHFGDPAITGGGAVIAVHPPRIIPGYVVATTRRSTIASGRARGPIATARTRLTSGGTARSAKG
jgi:hypothetical protein